MSEVTQTQDTSVSTETPQVDSQVAETNVEASGEETSMSDIINEVNPNDAINENNDEVNEEGQTAEEVEEEIKELKKMLKLKVDGQEFEEEIDFNNDEDLVRRLQKAKAFDKRSQELAALREQVNEFVGQLKGNPAAILEQLGLNFDDLAEAHLAAKLEQMKKSPEEIAKEEMEAELKRLREEKEEAEKVAEQTKLEQMKNEHAAKIQDDIITALDSGTTTLPKSPQVMQRVAQTMLLAMQNGYPQVTAAEVIPVVEKQIRQEWADTFGKLPADILEDVIGKPNLDKIRKKRLKNRKVKTETANQIAKETANKGSADGQKEPEKQTYKDFFNLLT